MHIIIYIYCQEGFLNNVYCIVKISTIGCSITLKRIFNEKIEILQSKLTRVLYIVIKFFSSVKNEIQIFHEKGMNADDFSLNMILVSKDSKTETEYPEKYRAN